MSSGARYRYSRDETIYGNSEDNQPANTERYYSSDGLAAAADNVRGYIITTIGQITALYARSSNPAGAGETFIYTVMLNGAPTALAVQIGGAVQQAANAVGAIAVVPEDRLTIRLVTSAAAAATQHQFSMLHQH